MKSFYLFKKFPNIAKERLILQDFQDSVLSNAKMLHAACSEFSQCGHFLSHLNFLRKISVKEKMIEQDETDCSSFFDHIDDLLDFPADEIDVGAASLPAAVVICQSFPSIWPTESDSVFSESSSVELSVPVSLQYFLKINSTPIEIYLFFLVSKF